MPAVTPVFAAALTSLALLSPVASAPHSPCKVLTAEQFGRIMGYAAVVDSTASTAMTCFYTGPNHSGGQFMILTEAAGPQADALLTRRGSTPPPGSGLVGGTYKQGMVIFSLSVRSSDPNKLQALVAAVRRNLE
jgi:hypothetical protein